MARVIKFRAWLKLDPGTGAGRWLEEHEFKVAPNGSIATYGLYVHKGAIEVTEFTGLTDKHETEIFEGDVGKSVDDIIWHVKWDADLARFVSLYDGNVIEDLSEVASDMEIIGNIYENSDLLA